MTRTKVDLAIILILIIICVAFALLAKFFVYDSTPKKEENDIQLINKDLPARNPNIRLLLPTEMADWNRLKDLPIKTQENSTIRVPILLYHHIDPPPENGNKSYYVSAQTFDRQMRWLYNNNYNVIPLSNLVNFLETGQNPPPKKSLVITFDDGTRGQYRDALPILQAYNFTATFYVVKDWLDSGQSNKKGDYFGWSEARNLLKAGMEIGSHSVDHKELAILSDSEAKYEVSQSKVELEKGLGVTINSYAYAGGSMTTRDWSYLQQAHYTSGTSVDKGIDHKVTQIYHLKRMHIDNDLPYFIARIEGKYDK